MDKLFISQSQPFTAMNIVLLNCTNIDSHICCCQIMIACSFGIQHGISFPLPAVLSQGDTGCVSQTHLHFAYPPALLHAAPCFFSNWLAASLLTFIHPDYLSLHLSCPLCQIHPQSPTSFSLRIPQPLLHTAWIHFQNCIFSEDAALSGSFQLTEPLFSISFQLHPT